MKSPRSTKPLKNMTELELKEQIIYHQQEINKNITSLLEHALKCGKVLLEVKRRMKHGEFKKWLEDNFEDSYPTLSVYMRIAKNWDTPAIQEGLEAGVISSIVSFLNALSPDSKQPTKKLTKQQRQDYEVNVKYLCKTFKEYITGMEPAEIAKLAKWFDVKIWHRWEEIMNEELNKVPTENIKFPKPKLQKTAP